MVSKIKTSYIISESAMKTGKLLRRADMVSEIIKNKINKIEYYIKRIQEEYDNTPENLENCTKQDSIIYNLQRAVEASNDIAMHIIASKKLGLPQNSMDAYSILKNEEILSPAMFQKMKAMLDLTNAAVYAPHEIDLELLKNNLENHLSDLLEYTNTILMY